MFTLQVRLPDQTEHRTIYASYRSHEEAAASRDRWRDNYVQWRDASFRILDPLGRVVHR